MIMKLTESDKQELYDSITFIIETINEFPEYAKEILDNLGWGGQFRGTSDIEEMPNVKLLQNIRKKLFQAEKRPFYRSYMD